MAGSGVGVDGRGVENSVTLPRRAPQGLSSAFDSPRRLAGQAVLPRTANSAARLELGATLEAAAAGAAHHGRLSGALSSPEPAVNPERESRIGRRDEVASHPTPAVQIFDRIRGCNDCCRCWLRCRRVLASATRATAELRVTTSRRERPPASSTLAGQLTKHAAILPPEDGRIMARSWPGVVR
jgi:hypothetical protein